MSNSEESKAKKNIDTKNCFLKADIVKKDVMVE